MFSIVDPSGRSPFTRTTSVNRAVAPASSVARVALKVPVPPTGGVLSVNAGPEVWVALTKVVPAGTASLRETDSAASGPSFLSSSV